MSIWKIASEAVGVVGSKTVYATVVSEKGYVNVTGLSEAVEQLLDSLNNESKPEPDTKKTTLMRFVFVNKDGAASAMAFECATQGELMTLHDLEQIENYASQKLGESVLAQTWSVMAPAAKIVPVTDGQDVVGGVKCDAAAHGDPGDENDAKLK